MDPNHTTYDKEGNHVYTDGEGQILKWPDGQPIKVPRKNTSSGFTTYEGEGVCCFCGSYRCRGTCFR